MPTTTTKKALNRLTERALDHRPNSDAGRTAGRDILCPGSSLGGRDSAARADLEVQTSPSRQAGRLANVQIQLP